MVPEDLDQLLGLLDLRTAGEGVYQGPPSPAGAARTFGGQLTAQALTAAGATSAGRPPKSLHCHFLVPARSNRPVDYRVERLRDGRSIAVRHVQAEQDGKLLLRMTAAFHTEESGFEHHVEMPVVDPPERLPVFAEHGEPSEMGAWLSAQRMFDLRFCGPTPFDSAEPGTPPRQRLWLRTAGALPDDPLLHCALLTYASDMTLFNPVLLVHGQRWSDQGMVGATLDHSLWFHRVFRVDGWLLLDHVSPVSHAGLAFARSEAWTADGRPVASVAQESLIRPSGGQPAERNRS